MITTSQTAPPLRIGRVWPYAGDPARTTAVLRRIAIQMIAAPIR